MPGTLDVLAPVNLADPVDRHHALNRGRVAWWVALPGLDGGKTWYDLIGSIHGTLTNMTSAASGWQGTTRPGGWGHLQFDGVDDGVLIGTPAALELYAKLTVFVWIRANTSQDGHFSIAKDFSTGARNYALGFNSTKLYLEIGGSPGISGLGPSLVDGAWHRVGFTYDGATWTGYVDGLSVGTSSHAAPTANPSASWYLGRRAYVGAEGYYNGSIDDASIWSRALSAAEVAADLDLSRRGYPGVLNRLDTTAWMGPAPPAANPAALLMVM